MKEKILDFKRFGKWSLSTLCAQSGVGSSNYRIVFLPNSVTKELYDVQDRITSIKNIKTKELTLGKVIYYTDILKKYLEEEKIYFEMKKLVEKELLPNKKKTIKHKRGTKGTK